MSTTNLVPSAGRLLDSVAAADYLGVSERWVRRAVAERRVPVVKVGRLVRISTGALDALIEAGTRPAADHGDGQ